MNFQEQNLTILEISQKLDIPKPTLRFWEKEFSGILVPLRTKGGQRRYSAEHISVIEKIITLKKAGLSLGEIKKKLGNGDNGNNFNPESIDILAERVAEIVRSEVIRFFEKGEE